MRNLEERTEEGIGTGMAEGMMAAIDPIGIAAQYFGRKKGYDVRTIGGLGFFGMSEDNVLKTIEKVIAGGLTALCWRNPDSLPYLLAIEGAATAINAYANIKRLSSIKSKNKKVGRPFRADQKYKG